MLNHDKANKNDYQMSTWSRLVLATFKSNPSTSISKRGMFILHFESTLGQVLWCRPQMSLIALDVLRLVIIPYKANSASTAEKLTYQMF